MIILAAARKHGLSDQQIRHALDHVIRFHEDDDMTMAIGPTQDGDLIEVGIVQGPDDELVVHAMKARPKYL